MYYLLTYLVPWRCRRREMKMTHDNDEYNFFLNPSQSADLFRCSRYGYQTSIRCYPSSFYYKGLSFYGLQRYLAIVS